MLGKIIEINENIITVKLEVDTNKLQSLSNLLVVMQDEETNFVGEITNVNKDTIYVNLLGEINDEKFVFGIIKKPSFNAVIKLISKDKVKGLISTTSDKENEIMYIGKSTIYDGIDINVNVNDFMSNHFAIFGSTGSGKSCGVARILQNLFSKQQQIPYKSNIFIFDAYGEYHSAFIKLHETVPEINFKAYTTNLETTDSEILRIPLWLLSIDDIALLLGATNHNQIPIIEKALKLVSVFAKQEHEVLKTKNDIIARALIDII